MARVLVVEDHPGQAHAVVRALACRHEAMAVMNATDALAWLGNPRSFAVPDAVVLDVGLPDAPDPVALLTAVRRVFAMRLVLASGDDREAIHQLAADFGATTLPKPFGLDALLQAIEERGTP